MTSRDYVISLVRDRARELGALCAEHDLVRLETLLWALEQAAMMEALLSAAETRAAEAEPVLARAV